MKTNALFLGVLFGLGSVITPCGADTYIVKLDRSATSRTMSGRLMIFFITEREGRWRTMEPRHGPFFSKPQPIGSVLVESLEPGESIEIDTFESVFPTPLELDRLAGTVRVQAVLDMDRTMRSHNDGPGNVYSDVVEVELTAGPDDRVELVLLNQMRPPTPPETEYENLQWVEVKSELLSAFYGREVYHRAGVAFPLPYFDKSYPQRDWPAIYEIPGYGGRHFGAVEYAQMFHARGIEEVAPMAVTIVLDPDSPLGHHGFVDSPNHGPRGTALVRELIPYLEEKFRLVSKPEARLLTGHSSGGWASLWLQLRWPEVFGGCWSSAPDPIDFSAFQMTNLYEDENLYVMADGEPTPSMRYISGPRGETTVSMTVREEALMEWAMHPRGGSGQQWDAWEAMFSRRPRGRENLPGVTALPRPLFDAVTGKINRNVVEHWSRFDITRMVRQDWERYGPIVTGRIRLVCGELDSYYLNRAVERFKAMVLEKAGEHEGPGFVRLVRDADHGNIRNHTFIQTNEQMRAHLRGHGLHEW